MNKKFADDIGGFQRNQAPQKMKSLKDKSDKSQKINRKKLNDKKRNFD